MKRKKKKKTWQNKKNYKTLTYYTNFLEKIGFNAKRHNTS